MIQITALFNGASRVSVITHEGESLPGSQKLINHLSGEFDRGKIRFRSLLVRFLMEFSEFCLLHKSWEVFYPSFLVGKRESIPRFSSGFTKC
jgi:hypothetical protein